MPRRANNPFSSRSFGSFVNLGGPVELAGHKKEIVESSLEFFPPANDTKRQSTGGPQPRRLNVFQMVETLLLLEVGAPVANSRMHEPSRFPREFEAYNMGDFPGYVRG